jgi:hypothetical protein
MLAQKSSRSASGDLGHPGRVDLHRTNVDGAIGVETDPPQRPTFNIEQNHQNDRWHMIDAGGGINAACNHGGAILGRIRLRHGDRKRKSSTETYWP